MQHYTQVANIVHTDNKKLQVYLSDYLRQDTLYGHKMYDTTFVVSSVQEIQL